MNRNNTYLRLIEGGTTFKQGDRVNLSFEPLNYKSEVVDLAGKNISTAIRGNGQGIIFEGTATWDAAKQAIVQKMPEELDHGTLLIEFVVTDPGDAEYKVIFPSNEKDGKLKVNPSSESMEVVGVKAVTVTQLRAEQEAKQQEFESNIIPQVENIDTQLKALVVQGDSSPQATQASVGARGEDYGGNLKARLDAEFNETTTLLAETGEQVDVSIENGMERAKPLFIKTFDGSHETFHPSTKHFSTGWNGFKYWMAYTPYPYNSATPPYRDRWECPSIAVSNDGLNWIKPTGLTNPIVDLTAAEITRKDFYSDPSIVMNGSIMEVWYRKTNGADTSQTDIYRVTSSNGINWSVPEKVIDSQNASSGIGRVVRSHQVFYGGGTYEIYFVGDNPRRIYYASTQNPSSGVWGNSSACTLSSPPAGFNPWHVGMNKDDAGNLHLLAYDNARGSVDYFISSGTLTFEFVKTILTPNKSIERWYQTHPVLVNGEWLVYASFSKNRTNGITLLKGKSLVKLSVVDVDKNADEGYLFEGDVVLNNNVNTPRVFAVEKTGDGKTHGYGMRNSTKEPIWLNGGFSDQRTFQMFTSQDIKTYVPKKDSELVLDSGGGGLFAARLKGTAFRFVGLNAKLNQTRLIEATVDIAKNEVITFTGAGAGGNTAISQVIGLEPYQTVTFINLSGVDITINDSSVANGILTQSRAAYTLKSGAAVQLIASLYQTNLMRWHLL